MGQGLFCTERFSLKEGDPSTINLIYDCGTLNSQKLVDDAIIDEFGPLVDGKKVDIDYLFLSHFHADHISGLTTLQKYCNIKEYVIPVLSTDRIAEAYIFNIVHDSGTANAALKLLANRNMQGIMEIETDDNSIYPLPDADDWLIKPYMPSVGKYDKLEEKLKKAGLSDLWKAFEMRNFTKIDDLVASMGKEQWRELKVAYEKACGGDHTYMLTMYSGYNHPTTERQECNALYCGDYEALDKTAIDVLMSHLDSRWPKVGTLQVPHHGSRNNNCQDLYDAERHCVISYGVSNFKHPHIETINYILNAQNGKALDTLHLVNSGSSYSQSHTI